MYKSSDLQFGTVCDTQTKNYDDITGVYLTHSCSEWVIGPKENVLVLIKDLQEILKEFK